MKVPTLYQLKKAQLKIRAISHPDRMRIIKLLEEKGSLYVQDIQFELRKSQSTTSQHLATLRRAGYVSADSEGKNVKYSLEKLNLSEDVSLIMALIK